jgi:hypothetical protein
VRESRKRENSLFVDGNDSYSLSFAIYLTCNRDPEDVVKLYAGEDETQKPLSLHKQIACYYSPVFKAAFNSLRRERPKPTSFQTRVNVLSDF